MAPWKHKLQAFLGFPDSPTDQQCLFAKVSGGAAPDRYPVRNINESHFPVNKKVREKRREIVHLDKLTLPNKSILKTFFQNLKFGTEPAAKHRIHLSNERWRRIPQLVWHSRPRL